MAQVKSDQPLLPSVLDRLIDHEPDVSTEPLWWQSQNLNQYRRSVLRDVENLLNTRPVDPHLAEQYDEAALSVLTYGLPDFTAAEIGGLDERERLRRAVERTIHRFEPRLRDARVSLHAPENDFDRTLRMTVHALLWVEPNPEPIAFETLVQPALGTCKVEST